MVSAEEQARLNELETQRQDYLRGWEIGTRAFGTRGRHAPTRDDSAALKQGFQDARKKVRYAREYYLHQLDQYKEQIESARLKRAAEQRGITTQEQAEREAKVEESKKIIAGKEYVDPLAYAKAYGGQVIFKPEQYTVKQIQEGEVSVLYKTKLGDITFTPQAEKPSTLRRIGETAGVILPAGYELREGVPQAIVYPREVKDYSYKKETIAAGIPTATEILSMSAIVRQITSTTKGAGKITRGVAAAEGRGAAATRIDIVAGSKLPRAADITLDISRQHVQDVSKAISKGAGRGITIETKAGRDILTTVKSVGAAEEVGAARLVQAGASREIGTAIISESYIKELTKTLYRKGIKIGVPAEEVLPVTKGLTKQRVYAAAIPTEEGVTILATAREPLIRKVLTPKGIVPRARFKPDIRLDLAYGKFPDTFKTISDIQKIKPIKLGDLGKLKLLPVGKKAQAFLTPQIQKAIVSQLAALPKTTTVLRPTLAPLGLRPVSVPRVSQQPIVTPRLTPTLPKKPDTKPLVQEVIARNLVRDYGLSPKEAFQKVGLKPRVTPRIAQIPKQIPVQRVSSRFKQVPRLAQVPRQAIQVRQVSKQLGRLAQVPKLTTQLRIQQRVAVRPTTFGIPRISIPKIALPPVAIPSFDLKPIKIPKLKKKKRKARDDYGISETFVQRQLLLPLAKPLRIRGVKI